MMDQLRFDSLGYSSNNLVDTPNIDWLANMGTVFTSAYSPSSTCIPARASLMTGEKPWTNGVLFTGNSAGPHKKGGVMGVNFEHTIPGELVKNGYHAEGIGKMHFFPQRAHMGFSHTLIDESGREEDKNFISDYKKWFLKHNPEMQNITDHGVHWNSWMARPFHADEAYHPSNWTVNECLDFLGSRPPEMPFFLKMSFSRPHSPYDASEYFFNMYKEMDLPSPVTAEWSEKYKDFNGSVLAWHGDIGEKRCKLAKAGYYGSITQTDYQIGKFLTTINKQKLLDEMLIIFTSDHGDMMGDHYLHRKTYPYEGSSHVPMIIKLPKSLTGGKKQQKVCDAPVSLYDLMPTILDVCGCDIPSTCEGISLKGLCLGEKTDREFVQSEHIECYSKEFEHFMVTDGKRKYIYYLRTGKETLFDLEKDRYETVDQIDNPSYWETIDKMRDYTVKELEKRNSDKLTFVKDGKLVPIPENIEIISPNYEKRLETSDFKWM